MIAADPAALVNAVSAAVGDGSAMPVVRASEPYAGHNEELIGVVSDQLPDVALWREHSRQELAQLADLLRGEGAAPLSVTGYLEADVTASALTGKPRLAAMVAIPGSPTRTVTLGLLANGRHTYRAEISGCDSGCRLIALTVSRQVPGTSTVDAQFSLASLTSAAGPVNAGFANPGQWRVESQRSPQAQVTVHAGQSLEVAAHSTDPGDVVIEYVDTPDELPVVVAGGSPADDVHAGSFTFPALGETPQSFDVVGRVDALPRAGGRALLFDLDYAVRAAQRTSTLSDNSRLRYEVWANAQAPADLSARLAAAGLQVLDEQSMTAVREDMGRAAPALGLRLYLIAGAAAVLLAVGAVLLTAYIGSSARRYELSALRVSGVSIRTLRWGLLREYLMLIGLPLVVGLAAGVAGAALMLPGIPLVNVGQAIGAVRYRPGIGVLPVSVAITLIGLALAVLVVLRLVRGATPERLREGADI